MQGGSRSPRRYPLLLALALLLAAPAVARGAYDEAVTENQNPGHTAFASGGSLDQPPLSERWSVALGTTVGYPIIAGGRVFVHSYDPAKSAYTIQALDESSWDAFAGLVEANDGVFGGCWCMGFHPDDSREPALNRERKLARVRAGRAHAALVFDGDDCVGWCQFGAPDEVPKIKNRAAYEKSVTTLPDWRIACNFVGKGHRRQGVATAALDGALELIARLGGGKVEGYLSRSRRFGSCRLPLQRRPVDLREAWIRPRPQDRQAPLGRHQGRRANLVAADDKRRHRRAPTSHCDAVCTAVRAARGAALYRAACRRLRPAP